ncbi:MAG: LamG-like jellyroll fold domain-containing protein [Victivallaceae bacterium]|jgi:hypothetical protein
MGLCFKQKSYFTLVEMFIVISIVGILIGMMLPALAKAQIRAKYVRWLGFNAQNNRDPDTVINYNFEAVDFQTKVDGVYTPTLYNGALACNIPGYDSASYNGILSTTVANPRTAALNLPQWVQGGGRWMFLKNALSFNGANSYVAIPGTKCINFDPSTQDFTILMWVNFNTVRNVQCLFGKNNTLTGNSQYDLYLSTSLRSRVGNSSMTRTIPAILPSAWYHIALVNKAKVGVKMYLNGTLMTGGNKPALPVSYMATQDLVIGASSNGVNARGVPRFSNWFSGFMDEYLMFGKALSDKEIMGQYKMGMP